MEHYYDVCSDINQGLTPQVFFIINHILHESLRLHSRRVYFRGFQPHFLDHDTIVPLEEILDLTRFNDFLLLHYRITIHTKPPETDMELRPMISGWVQSLSKPDFDRVLEHVPFHPRFVRSSLDYVMTHLDLRRPINVLHFRLEDDGVRFWSRKNNLSETAYRERIIGKYQDIVSRFISPNDQNLVLSFTENPVMEYMRRNGYSVIFMVKEKQREMSAILDFLLSRYCNNIFIGNINLHRIEGSSFDYMALRHMYHVKRSFMVDIDFIDTNITIVDGQSFRS